MTTRSASARPYAAQGHDAVRAAFDQPWTARAVARLVAAAAAARPAGRRLALLDLGCGDGRARGWAGSDVRYAGVDLDPPAGGPFVRHDLRDGLGPVGREPFDVYFGGFGIASHLAPGELRRLLREIALHARPGALVAVEALGLRSLEWPRLWETAPGPSRSIPYRLAAEVIVHPWAPAELLALMEDAGVRPLGALDRTLQAGPKLGVYWPGLPAVRDGIAALLAGDLAGTAALVAPLPPLPAGEAALVHHTLAVRRRDLVRRARPPGPELARAVWALEPPTAGGFGHGVLAVGRVTGAPR